MLEIHLDPLGGIAGDMFVAAVLDFRPDLEPGLTQALALCPLIGDVTFDVSGHNDGILTGKRFVVRRHGQAAETAHHHHHDTDAGHRHEPHHGHVHWSLIREALLGSKLDAETVRHAIGIFTGLAEAEARVHGTIPNHVSFHEVGAWDSIADIVAAAWLIKTIGAKRWTVGALPLGSGRVRSAHGLLPVPAPATALLLEGFTTIDDGIPGERVTPTGAAILRYLCPLEDAPRTPRRLAASAHGFGTKRLQGISNCLRLLAFEATDATLTITDRIAVLECEIDDQTGEDLAQAIDNLRSRKGVLDIVQAPVFGKKGRVMTQVRILAEETAQDEIVAAIFDETTTIGLRRSLVERSILPRATATVESGGRTFRLKVAHRPSGDTVKVEADDVAGIDGSGTRNRLRHTAEALFHDGKDGK
ncbi:LarC family nickel insertion protein [Rhizobium laguerreae]|uniref:LarC family nickel insertion protein n=1 Tax=Rhizobium laguerreae TaxID=1076926 RepID=UPI001C914668|nr:LarC family nickel insertion protein [Rhizobium laguerreae]MBY3307809.1 LarC family nickel insertion protein [Rhizobium laguerreae]